MSEIPSTLSCEHVSDKKFYDERVRLQSFANYPKWAWARQTPYELARAGFYYLDCGDWVRCPFCEGVVSDWSSRYHAMGYHWCLFPRCKFPRQMEIRNIPIRRADLIFGQPICLALYSPPPMDVEEKKERKPPVSKRKVKQQKKDVKPPETYCRRPGLRSYTRMENLAIKAEPVDLDDFSAVKSSPRSSGSPSAKRMKFSPLVELVDIGKPALHLQNLFEDKPIKIEARWE